jgi:hypothetical protein
MLPPHLHSSGRDHPLRMLGVEIDLAPVRHAKLAGTREQQGQQFSAATVAGWPLYPSIARNSAPNFFASVIAACCFETTGASARPRPLVASPVALPVASAYDQVPVTFTDVATEGNGNYGLEERVVVRARRVVTGGIGCWRRWSWLPGADSNHRPTD